MLLVFGAPCQLLFAVGPEHGRTIALADIECENPVRRVDRPAPRGT